jgi:hypothetical protein
MYKETLELEREIGNESRSSKALTSATDAKTFPGLLRTPTEITAKILMTYDV